MPYNDVYTSLCFTGHRILSRAELADAEKKLELLLALITDGKTTPTVFNTGGALGFDTAAAKAVLRLREHVDGVRLNVMSPCRDQSARWNEEQKATFRSVIERADSHEILFPYYTPYCMLARDRKLVDRSLVCIAYMRPGTQSGGTRYTVDYAHMSGKAVINLAVTDEATVNTVFHKLTKELQ